MNVKLPEFLAFATCSKCFFKNTTGTKQNLPGGEICFMGFQHRSSEQAMVIRRAKCEEGKEVAHFELQRRVSASQGADRGLSSVVRGQC